MSISDKDKEILRRLAAEYMEYATLPVQNEKIKLWKSLNKLQMTKPMVVIDQLPWNELNAEGELTLRVEAPFFRSIECDLRRQCYKWKHFPADMVLNPYITIQKAVYNSGYGINVQEDTMKTDPTSSVISHSYINQFETEEDLDKIKVMVITHDVEETKKREQMAETVFEGIAPVKSAGISFHSGIWDHISFLMGVENAYIDLLDRPEFIHKIVRKMTDSTIHGIEQANALMVHDDTANTCHCSYTYSDEPKNSELPGNAKNCWTFAMAQLFTCVSAKTTEEFEIPYIAEIAKYFGNIYYGCCERLEDRLNLLDKIPNIKKVSCSPWNNPDNFAGNLNKNHIMSFKPNPAFLGADSFDEQSVKENLQEAISAAKANNVHLEIVLKDISTVKYDPTRLKTWNDIAMRLTT